MKDTKIKRAWDSFDLAESNNMGEMDEFDIGVGHDAYIEAMEEFRRDGSMTDIYFAPDPDRGEDPGDDDWSDFGPEPDEIDWTGFDDALREM